MRRLRLLLFDVDGTLVSTAGAGRRALDAAFAELYGWTDATAGLSFGGMTDRWIVRSVFARRGRDEVEAEAAREAFFAAYVRHLEREVARAGPACRTLPGVVELLERLAARGTCLLGLLTGNVEGGARAKLAACGLWGRFALGSYGDEAAERPGLLPIAMERAAALDPRARDLRPADVVVVGDTPHDVAVARAHGARALAVATGASSYEELSAHAPDLLVRDLTGAPAEGFLAGA